MSTFVKKQERESFEAMLRRFTRMVIGSKVITEAKDRQFFKKGPNRRARRASAVRREKIRVQKQRELY